MTTKFDTLAERFISDNNLPFQFIDWNHFRYCLELFNKIDDWNNLLDIISNRYDGNPHKFLDDYYEIRDNIIQGILNNRECDFFINKMDLNSFAITDEGKSITSNNIYNRTNVGKLFLSIDLKSANFQTLKHVSSALVNNKQTYEDFIGDYTDLDYIKKSKYTRQVIFGKTNPKRQITCERFFINEIRKMVTPMISDLGYKIVSMSNDEIVYEIPNLIDVKEQKIYNIIKTHIKEESDFDVHINVFMLNGYEFQNMETGTCKFTFYEKSMINGEKKLICVPMPYYKYVYKLMNNLPLSDDDYIFNYEGTKAEFIDEFQIKQL